MKKLAISFLFFLFCVGLSGCFSNDAGGPVPRSAPYTRVQLMSGDYVPIEQFKGKILAVTFWGSWCSGSKSTIQSLDELVQEVGSDKLVVLGISLDRASDAEQLHSVIQSKELNHVTHAFSGNESLDEAYVAYQAEDVPHIFVVNELGEIVAKGRSAGVVEDYLELRGLMPE